MIKSALFQVHWFVGITAGLAGGAALHAVRVLAGEGRIKPHDTVVVINPGTGK